MNKFLAAALFIAALAWYLSFLAGRLDRLHNRVETSWANLDGLLQRRAAARLVSSSGEGLLGRAARGACWRGGHGWQKRSGKGKVR
jgi:hypothetical protein